MSGIGRLREDDPMERGRELLRGAVYILIGILVFSLCLYPLSRVMEPALFEGGFGLDNILSVLREEQFTSVIEFTIFQAIISTIVTLIFALPGAYLLSRYRFPGKSVVLALTTVPFVLPPIVMGIGFIAIFGYQGYLNEIMSGLSSSVGMEWRPLELLYTKKIIILAHVFYNFPIALRILHSRMDTFDTRLIDASHSMGVGHIKTFFRVVLPQMKYSLISAASLVFTFCFLSFGVILVVGGFSHPTLEVEIYRQFRRDLSMAGALLIIEFSVVIAATALYIWSSRRSRTGKFIARGEGFSSRVSKANKWVTYPAVFLYVLIIGVVVIAPLLAVLHGSFVRDFGGESEYTLHWFRELLSRERDAVLGSSPMGSVLNSLLFGLLTVIISLPMAMAVAYLMDSGGFRGKIGLDTFLLIPIGVSTVSLGKGILMAYSSSLDLYNTWQVVVLVHVVIAYPFGARAIYTSRREIPGNLIKASESLGAGRLRTFLSVHLPLMLPGILVAAVFAFAISIGEFGATLIVSSPEYTTMPVALYRMLNASRDIGSATAYGAVLILFTFLSFLGIEFTARKIGRSMF